VLCVANLWPGKTTGIWSGLVVAACLPLRVILRRQSILRLNRLAAMLTGNAQRLPQLVRYEAEALSPARWIGRRLFCGSHSGRNCWPQRRRIETAKNRRLDGRRESAPCEHWENHPWSIRLPRNSALGAFHTRNGFFGGHNHKKTAAWFSKPAHFRNRDEYPHRACSLRSPLMVPTPLGR